MIDTNLKDHMRIDNDNDDNLIEGYKNSAIQAIVNSVGGSIDDKFYQNNSLFDLAVNMLTDHYYRERSSTTSEKQDNTSFGVQSIILQLKPSYRFWRNNNENS